MNIVKAIFSGGCTQITAAGALWQWDQGQILQIVGLDLPDAYQVEFSNQPVRGTAAPMIGGVDGVEIPDVYLTTGKPVYAFVVLHAGEDDRETEYKITIPVNARPQPTDVQPTPEQQGVIDQLIAALNAGVEKAEDAADEAEGAADDAAAQAQAAAQSASSSASYAGDAAAQAGLAAAAKAGAEAAQAAAELAQGSAEAFATAAGVAKAAAETAQGKAEDAQAAAEAAQAAAESAKAGALAAKAAAETAQEKAEDAQEAAEQAAQDAHVEYEQLAGQVTAQGQTIAQHGQAIAQNTEDIADLDTELTRQKSALTDLTALVDRKAGMLVDTASGAIASFVPDATIDNLLGVTVDIEPQQGLHGYDHPWPAGGGVNKLSSDNMSRFTQKNYGVQYTVQADGGIAAAGTVTTTTWNFAQFYATLDDFGLSVGDTVALSCFGDNVNFAIHFYADNTMIRGIDAAGTPVGVIPEGTNRLRMLVYCKSSAAPTVGEVINKTIYPQLEKASTPSTVWHPYSNICPISGWDAVSIWNKPTHDTTLPPTVTIQLGQTVYGGTLDVTTGTLTVTESKIIVDGTKFSWSYYNGAFYASFSEYKKGVEYTAMSDYLRFVPQNTSVTALIAAGRGTFSFRRDSTSHLQLYPTDESIASSQMLNAYLNEHPLTIVYPLATPITIQLDPATISTISGQTNNVWADAGDVSVEFAADVKTYIDNKIAAAVAALS